jgi:hypothetical protein
LVKSRILNQPEQERLESLEYEQGIKQGHTKGKLMQCKYFNKREFFKKTKMETMKEKYRSMRQEKHSKS